MSGKIFADLGQVPLIGFLGGPNVFLEQPGVLRAGLALMNEEQDEIEHGRRRKVKGREGRVVQP